MDFKIRFIRRIRARLSERIGNKEYSAYSALIPAISGENLAKEIQIGIIQAIRADLVNGVSKDGLYSLF